MSELTNRIRFYHSYFNGWSEKIMNAMFHLNLSNVKTFASQSHLFFRGLFCSLQLSLAVILLC